MKILFLSANPKKTERLRFDKEFREIKGSIAISQNRKKIDVRCRTAITPKDLQSNIEKEKPDVIHFSGHGNSNGEIILEDDAGNPKPVSAETFARIFYFSKNQTKCVVLNCCYSAIPAKEIGRNIDCVIGIKTDIADGPAIAFASGFYLALGEKKDLKLAFDFAVNEFILKGGLIEEKPELFIRSGINPSQTYLIRENE